MQQHEALSLLKMGKNVFLTGAAGAGKTYLLNQYIQYLKDHQIEVAVTASTGIAATHLQGTTIHAWSGIGVRDSLTQKDLEKLLKTQRIKRNYKKTKVLIIDEISMLHKHQLDMVDEIARYILEATQVFGGIQVVLCGDFFQLPPIAPGAMGEKPFAFDATTWETGNFHICYLHEQHRQGNDPLLTVLNDIRNGTAGEHTKVPLRTRYKKEPQGYTKATKLYSRNINVDVINERELASIPGQEKIFKMTTKGYSVLVEGLKKSCLAVECLKLKIGAEVMFIKNDMTGKYVNGTRSVVVGFDPEDGWPIVRTYDNHTFVVYPEEWKYEDNGIIRAIMTQVPLRLAWALTIHKSQGMTLDAAEIDLGDAFEPGMGYVALSRVRSLAGLKLMNLNEMALKVHPKVLQCDEGFKESSAAIVQYLNTLSEEEIIECHRSTLIGRFGGGKPKKIGKIPKQKKVKPQQTPTHLITLALLKEKLSLEAIAAQRELTARTIITHLEKLKGLQQLDQGVILHLKEAIPTEDFECMFAELEYSEEPYLKPCYDKFEGKYSYEDLAITRLFVNL